jgi:hypothetical protein
MTGVGAVAAWTSPVLVVAVVARVTAGGVETPLFVLAVLAAPMLALLAGGGPRGARSGFATTISLLTVVCALGAGFRAVADLGHVLGLETGATLGAAVALVLVTTTWRDHHRVAATALALGAAALSIALVIAGVAVAVPPWTAWSRVASRGAFELGERSEWTREGTVFSRPTTLTFTEPHTITAATDAVLQVTERDRVTNVRERRLAAGESLPLRPGDSLAIPAGVRVRFERGRRVPGAPASGVTWADAGPVPARLLAWWTGLTLTLTGGALMIVRPSGAPSRASAIFGPGVTFLVVLAATCWGVYAVDAAPELSMEVPAASVLVRLAPVVADEPWRSRILTAIVLALLALFLGAAAALRRCLSELTAPDSGDLATSARRRAVEAATWVAMVVAAVAASLVVTDGFTLLTQGSGLAAAILLGPLLTRGDGPGAERARAQGALVGGLIFVVVAALARWPGATGPVEVVVQHPALVAAPAAWLVTTLSRRPE